MKRIAPGRSTATGPRADLEAAQPRVNPSYEGLAISTPFGVVELRWPEHQRLAHVHVEGRLLVYEDIIEAWLLVALLATSGPSRLLSSSKFCGCGLRHAICRCRGKEVR
jgi:hypothetical protein